MNHWSDETVEINAEYANDENDIQLNITDNNTDDGVTVTGYKIYARKNNTSVFSVVEKGTTIDETWISGKEESFKKWCETYCY